MFGGPGRSISILADVRAGQPLLNSLGSFHVLQEFILVTEAVSFGVSTVVALFDLVFCQSIIKFVYLIL